jgi:hypothetical protein
MEPCEINPWLGYQRPAIFIGDSFDWVERVSINLTTQMLATLFDFTRLWQERKGREGGFDLLTLLQRDPNTRDLVERPNEYLGNLLLLIVGGNETTRNSISVGYWP